MNADLEATLAELGDEYREMVARMKAAYEPAVAAPRQIRRGRIIGWSMGYLVAASLLVIVGFGVVLGQREEKPSSANAFMLAHRKGAAAVEEMIRTQRPDGGWGNDFITRQNIAALNGSSSAEARLAMRRAMRNLRLRGLL